MQSSNSVIDFIGNTPLVKLRAVIPQTIGSVYVKLEEFNAGGSIKSRVAKAMITAAEAQGILRPFSGQTIIEPTGGNLGIGLAMVAAVRGYKTILVMPDNYSKEKQLTLRKLGAEVVLADSTTGNAAHIHKAQEIIAAHPEYIYLNQFTNLANPQAHYNTTGAEILKAVPNIKYFVSSIGSGGTITGVGQRLKEYSQQIQIIAVQPLGCDVLQGKVVPHKIQGTALGIIPPFLARHLISGCITVTDEQCMIMQQSLATTEGLFVGISSAANIYAACFLARSLAQDQVVVTVAPDSGKSYLSME